MTTFICWAGHDSRRVTSLYFASDSRISWSRMSHWECGRKLFASRRSNDLFGYCGEVLFPALALSSLVQMLDAGFMSTEGMNPTDRHNKILDWIYSNHATGSNIPREDVKIFHAAREGENMKAKFHVWETSYSKNSKSWVDKKIDCEVSESRLVLVSGTGANSYHNSFKNIAYDGQARTSRSYFWALCDSLNSGADPYTGGAPQIVAMYATGAPLIPGVIFNDERYYLGNRVEAPSDFEKLEWRDELFQRIDPTTRLPLEGTQRHGRARSRAG